MVVAYDNASPAHLISAVMPEFRHGNAQSSEANAITTALLYDNDILDIFDGSEWILVLILASNWSKISPALGEPALPKSEAYKADYPVSPT